MPKYADLTKKDGKVEYRGRLWEVNKPVKSDRPGKKYMVLARKGDEVRLIHFGAKGYSHNFSEEAKKNYLARSAGIRGKDGKLTKNDKFSPNYWARKFLWPQDKEANGSTAREDSFAARVPELRLEGRSPSYIEGWKSTFRGDTKKKIKVIDPRVKGGFYYREQEVSDEEKSKGNGKKIAAIAVGGIAAAGIVGGALWLRSQKANAAPSRTEPHPDPTEGVKPEISFDAPNPMNEIKRHPSQMVLVVSGDRVEKLRNAFNNIDAEESRNEIFSAINFMTRPSENITEDHKKLFSEVGSVQEGQESEYDNYYIYLGFNKKPSFKGGSGALDKYDFFTKEMPDILSQAVFSHRKTPEVLGGVRDWHNDTRLY